ncbi:MAG: DEAD/DEAH box helicase family protein [Desulfovibrio sp.]|nr:DEAD/DEAH box helicase family protein [Desulfovibrio sp.]
MDENSFYEHPILSSPYECPNKHWELKNGVPTYRIICQRRPADFVTPIPKPRKSKKIQIQGSLINEAENIASKITTTEQQYHLALINELRGYLAEWRKLPLDKCGVSPTTQKLLHHWRHHNFSSYQPFFCQIEAVETAIWLVEVAPNQKRANHKKFLEYLSNVNENANSSLSRIALKLATGAGKTTVMAMIIAWQTLNAVRYPKRQGFTKGFLVVAPGITIKDRLRVLLPNDPDSYYQRRELVPPDMLRELQQARIVITNYHALRLREKVEISKGTRSALQGWRNEPLQTFETEGEMLQRVMPELMNLERIVVINDEAHHCYQARPLSEDEKEIKLSADEKREAEENTEAARVWISGLKIVQNKFKNGILKIFDLSATPFFLSGSGYVEGTIFPWTMSDFSLMDAIECGIVKLPRVPITGNIASNDVPMYRNLWDHIKKKMPKKKDGAGLDPLALPVELQTALDALYGHYAETFKQWKENEIPVPPCFIIVCNNTVTSKLIYDFVSGFYRDKDDQNTFVNGRLELFRNFDENGNPYPRPRTLLIDSQQLDRGDVLEKNFTLAAKDEIERFKREILIRGGNLASELRSGKELSEATILREVMNTVGKQGQLGESIRCVVSVSMLTEGWDANNVTHILGVRAFGTQLLCEQVIGRALRRYSYNMNEENLFDPEYADVLGIPFDFADRQVKTDNKPPKETVHVHAVLPEREHLEITFPRVAGYRVELPNEKLLANFNEESIFVLTPEIVGETVVENAAIIGEITELNLDHLDTIRENTIKMELTKYILLNKLREENENPRLYLFGQVKGIVSTWFDTYFKCRNETHPAQLIYKSIADRASEKICAAITRAHQKERPIRVILDPYNKEGSSRYVNFNSSKPKRYTTNPLKGQINYHICDSDWEMEFCRVAERHEKVKAYVKNQGMGFEVPYTFQGEQHTYIPDFILLVDDGHGDDLLHVVVEIKGYRREDALEKKTTMDTYWIPGVNRLKKYGRWAFAELKEVNEFKLDIEDVFKQSIEVKFNNMINEAVRSFNG